MRGLVVGYTLLDWLGGFMRGTYGASIIPVRPGLRCCLEGSHGACVLKLSLWLDLVGAQVPCGLMEYAFINQVSLGWRRCLMRGLMACSVHLERLGHFMARLSS